MSNVPNALTRTEAWTREGVTSPETTLTAQMGKVFGYLKGLHATHVIDIGTKLGLFQRLAEAPGLSPEVLSSLSGLQPPYVRQWCEAACALELLDYDPTMGFRLAPFMDQVLGQPDATFYLGGFPDVHLLVTRDYMRYPDLFRRGGTNPYK